MTKFDELDISGQRLPIMEHFLSIQGEGYHTGLASYFIRVGGCDVGCHWCDIKESWNPKLHPLTKVDDIISKIPQHIQTVVLTGGEPTLYNLKYLTNKLHLAKKQIHLETSGTNKISGEIDWICLSPKKKDLPIKQIYQSTSELKVIIQNKTDFEFAEQQADKVIRSCHLFLQPEWSKREKMIPQIIAYIEQNPKWKISLQTHKYINIP